MMFKKYTKKPIKTTMYGNKSVSIFEIENDNIDMETVDSFGAEWSKFNNFSEKEINLAGDQYFDIVSPDIYSGKSVLDVGCGTGRWSKYLASKARIIEAIDPSDAVISAAKLLQNEKNIRISKASVNGIPFPDNSFDFVFSLGVLHHIPDTQNAMYECVKKVKSGGYFLVYLYYDFDNRGKFYKLLFLASNLIRRVVCILPSTLKKAACDFLALLVYLPIISISKFLLLIGVKKIIKHIPLSYYADKSINIIRNDSLDRFGTPLEQRYSQKEIYRMMSSCGLNDIIFSKNEPFWHAIGRKK